MKTSNLAITTALFLGLASVSFAGPSADNFRRRANKTTATPPVATATVENKNTAKAEKDHCGSCRDVITYKPSPSGKTTTRIVK